ncbi:Biotin-(acetyl-CoA carboxylase) ligase [Ruegeria halocynthiae]|uniref:Biotin-(Acetyl-CoA carboxylase) ligase n=1 Tax=Ruegeria halocynthiae TaxID=985054 RepID=A0A1H2U622_9RHOB|nr:biotin/lipoate--protein ligase family protein [Ruegeria halocynthiae]SDW51318.1 Biotin-(acetyl-CoA carboxylase) ligase [Ruegeria halocynthiae]
MSEPVFPPLLTGHPVQGGEDPFARARALAALGCDSGTVVYNIQADHLRVAIVFAPEVALQDAMAMLPLCAVGFQNALGALAPPEVAVHLGWDGLICVNGARCGTFRAAASTTDPAEVPDWLIIGWELTLLQTSEAPGNAPDVTALYEEGCADVSATNLVESWSRHMMTWLNRWQEDGNAPLHSEWMGLLRGVGEPIAQAGVFLGTDDRFGMLIRDGADTQLRPLTELLETA